MYPLSISCLLLLLLSLLTLTIAIEKNPNIEWETYRMCASFHNEACSESNLPPGPCTDMHDCIRIVCDDTRPVGSCSYDMSLSWCEPQLCGFSRRQLNNPVQKLGGTIGQGLARLVR